MELSWELVAFGIFSVLTLGGGLTVVLERNLVHAALALMLSLFGIAGLFVILVAPFLAAVQVLVYIGAIAILILFSIMLTRHVMDIREAWNDQWIGAAIIALIVFGMLILTFTPLADEIGGDNFADLNVNHFDTDEAPEVNQITVEQIGLAFADRNGFMLPFELAALLLTAVLIGAIVIAREDEA
jgi:NADH-quinone oxidoreductase subunit J